MIGLRLTSRLTAGWPAPRRLRAVVLAVALAVSAGCTVGPRTELGQHPADRIGVIVVSPHARQRAPNLAGNTLSGKPLALADHFGTRATLLNVWASWCEPCRREMPILVHAAERRSGVRVVGIDEHDSVAAARAFTSSVGASYPSLVDSHSKLLMKLPMLPQAAVPSTLFIDSQGRVAACVIGPITELELNSVLARIRETR